MIWTGISRKGTSSGAGTANPSGTPEFIPTCFCGVRATQSSFICVAVCYFVLFHSSMISLFVFCFLGLYVWNHNAFFLEVFFFFFSLPIFIVLLTCISEIMQEPFDNKELLVQVVSDLETIWQQGGMSTTVCFWSQPALMERRCWKPSFE